MLVSDKPAELIGYFSAGEGAGFIVPLFLGRSSNMVLVQEIGVDGRVANFRQVEPRDMCRLDEPGRQLAIGEMALWGFRHADGRASIEERGQLRDELRPLIEATNPPFLKLQLAQFCEDQAELVGAWREAFAHLEERSPRSALAWRDVVVLPAQIRLAIETTILTHGLDASAAQLDRSVTVDIDRGHLRLRLRPDLYAALITNHPARAALERSVAPLRRAFHLSTDPLALLADAGPTGHLEAAEALADDLAIAGFGDMAMSLINQIVPRIRYTSPRASEYPGPPRASREMVLLQRREFAREVDWAEIGPVPKLDANNRVLLVVFQLSAGHIYLLDQAIDFTKKHRNKRRSIVAVIPHFPQEFDDPGTLANSVLPTLHKRFDAIWSLSDRTPHTRSALPFGPARSVQAAATQFRQLLNMARDEATFHQLKTKESRPSAINIIGSATGDRTSAKLTEHAMMRLEHQLFDFQRATSALVVHDGAPAFDGIIGEIVQRDAPHARISIIAAPKGDGGPGSISIALKNVDVLAGGAREFERYCVERLERYGWGIDQFEPDGRVHITQRGFDNVPTECKYIVGETLDTALRARSRRRQHYDGILLTNASIRRKTFAIHVLNGAMPMHCSRIEALLRIYRRRYNYALTYLQQEKKTSERIIVPAAIDWLNLHHLIDTKRVGKAKLAADGRAAVDYLPYSISLTLPLEFSRGRGAKTLIVPGEASLTLDETGWHLGHVEVDGFRLGN